MSGTEFGPHDKEPSAIQPFPGSRGDMDATKGNLEFEVRRHRDAGFFNQAIAQEHGDPSGIKRVIKAVRKAIIGIT